MKKLEYLHAISEGMGITVITQVRAMSLNSSGIEILNCVFIGCGTPDSGGALSAVKSNITLTENKFIGNKAMRNGGAIFAEHSSISLIGSTFIDNKAMEDGGAICTYMEIRIYTFG